MSHGRYIPWLNSLFVMVQCNAVKNEHLKTVDTLEDTCTFSRNNINSIQDLLDCLDIYSESWKKDCREYMQRIREQNAILKDKESQDYRSIHARQAVILVALEDFYEFQSEEKLEILEEAMDIKRFVWDKGYN